MVPHFTTYASKLRPVLALLHSVMPIKYTTCQQTLEWFAYKYKITAGTVDKKQSREAIIKSPSCWKIVRGGYGRSVFLRGKKKK